jgi:hypothetical protein
MSSSQETYGDDFGAERMWGLKELPLPDQIGLWPPAPGWYVVAALLVILFGYWCWNRYQKWKHDAYRRDGITAIEAMRADSSELQRLPFLLRRTALQTYPRTDVASLRGAEWIAWLNGSAGRDVFADVDADTFDSLTYQSTPTCPQGQDLQRILDGARYWMRNHRAAV